MLDRVLFVLVLIIIGVVTYATDWSELTRWSAPSEGLVRSLVLGVFMGLLVGAVFILKALWRKLFQRTPVQRP